MGEGRRLEREVALNATPEQVWETVSSGPDCPSGSCRTRCATARRKPTSATATLRAGAGMGAGQTCGVWRARSRVA